MKKLMIGTLLLVLCTPQFAGAQTKSKKQIIQKQNMQLDSMRQENTALMRDYKEQSAVLKETAAQVDALRQENETFRQKLDSLNQVTARIYEQINLQEQEKQKQAEAKKLQNQKAQAEKLNFAKLIQQYRNNAGGSENKLRDFINKTEAPMYPQTSQMLISAYNNYCQAGTISSVNHLQWTVSKSYLGSSEREEVSHSNCTTGGGCTITDRYTTSRYRYQFSVRCPNGKEYAAYSFDHSYEKRTETSYSYDDGVRR